jgi:serine/threonine protein phosphatase PrpC
MSILPVLLVWQQSLGQQVARDLQAFVDDLGSFHTASVELHLGEILLSTSASTRRGGTFARVDSTTRVTFEIESGKSFMSLDLLDEGLVEAERMLRDLRSSGQMAVEAPIVVVVCSSEFLQNFDLTPDSTFRTMARLGGGPEFVRIFKIADHGVEDGSFPDKSDGAVTATTLRGLDTLRSALRQVGNEVVDRVAVLSSNRESVVQPHVQPTNTGSAPARPTISPPRPLVSVEGGLSSGSDRSVVPVTAPEIASPNAEAPQDVWTHSDSASVGVEPSPRPTVFAPPSSAETVVAKVEQDSAVAESPSSDESTLKPPVTSSGEGDSSEETPGWRRKLFGRSKSADTSKDRDELPPPPSTSELAVDDAPELPKEEKRSVNGPLVVEFDSPLNRKVWHSDGWTKVPDAGPSRDFESEYGNVGNLRVIAGSMRGTKHKYYGDPNQDAFAIRTTKNHVIVAVSDGVSSAKYSAYASKYLTDLVVRRIQQDLIRSPQPTRDEAREVIQRAVELAAAGVSRWREGELFAPDEPSETVEIRDLAATLTVMVVDVELSQENVRKVSVAFVGDSPCYVLNRLEWTIKTSESKTGDVIDHATSALPVREGRPVHLEWAEFEASAGDSLLVMTDGIGTSLASGRSPVGRWMAPRVVSLLGPRLEANFFDLISFDRNGEDDDRTLVIVLDVNSTEFIGQEGTISGDQ